MALSIPQRRLIRLMASGHVLRIVRSPLDQTPVCAELLGATGSELVPWWRIERLLRSGAVKLDARSLAEASLISLVPLREAPPR